MIQDQSLKEIEDLILEMETLEQEVTRIKDQRKFTDEMIEAKQQKIQQARDQHEEKIRMLTRQSRKMRNKRSNRRDMVGDESPTVLFSNDPSPSAKLTSGNTTNDFHLTLSDDGTHDALGLLDVRSIEEALGPDSRKLHELAFIELQGHTESRISGSDAELHIESIAQSLQERLQGIQELNSKVAKCVNMVDHVQNDLIRGTPNDADVAGLFQFLEALDLEIEAIQRGTQQGS